MLLTNPESVGMVMDCRPIDRHSALQPRGAHMKSTVQMKKKKITVRRTSDIRLTSAACACPYTVNA